MSRYREMLVYAAVARTGSLAAAARELALSGATVMRTVAQLETRLGATLLQRSPRGIQLTASGERFAADCKRLLEHTAEAERSAAGVHSDPAGTLTIAAPRLMADQLFGPVAVDYLRAFPGMALDIQARDGVPRLLEEGLDAALVVGHLADSSGFALPVGHVRPLVCAAPRYLAQWGRPATVNDLQGHRIVHATEASVGPDWRAQGANTSRRVRIAPALTCTTQQAAISAAECGLGVIRCMSHEVHSHLKAGLLEPLLEAFPEPDLPVHLIYREGRRACARVRTFIDFAVPRLRAHPALR